VNWNGATTGRFLFLLQSAVWSSLFAGIEKLRYQKLISETEPPKNPVFIIGHWRTGTTYLHQLMNLNPAFLTPSLFQVAIPEGFMVSRQYYKPVMNGLVPRVRPMDNVKLGMDEPQEDEYALLRMAAFSPLEKLIFPDKPEFFLKCPLDFLPPPHLQQHWESMLKLFFTRLSLKSNRIIVSKNPFNSLRIPALYRLFPDARFIHIIRHPEEVIPSSIHMFDIVQRQNIMNRNRYTPQIHDILPVLDQVWTTIRKDLASLPGQQVMELKYNELVARPLESIKAIHEKFGFAFPGEVQNSIKDFASKMSSYQTNRFHLNEEDKMLIRNSLKHHYSNFGYE